MNNALVFLGIVLIGATACEKSKKNTLSKESTGVIMGRSFFKHACGERYWIKIQDSTAGFTYHDLPPWSGINPDFTNLADTVPVKVWWHNKGGCGIVIIDAVERIN